MITVLVFCSTMATMNGGLPGRAVEVQGHRGARALRPENTLAAFRHAL
ncbi:MAG: hypothetical protein FJ098_06950, partial [Deltaproteobacteria bacterium]|nr:hypothetical protein [Deltaproteobacteria bacterium]